MTRPLSTLIVPYEVISLYKFSDANPVQIDFTNSSNHWIIDSNRNLLNNKAFMRATNYFDKYIQSQGEETGFMSVEDLLHVFDIPNKEGPKLELPSQTFEGVTEVTVELWIAFKEFTARNFTVMGMSGRPWINGFGIAGAMNNSGALVNCIMGNHLIVEGGNNPCLINNALCKSLESLYTWYHLACAREDKAETTETKFFSHVILNSGPDEVLQLTGVGASISQLFDKGALTLGAKNAGNKMELGFNGYIREVRIWKKLLSVTDIQAFMYNHLEPLEHSLLVAYWPLVGGRMNNFFEASGSYIKDLSGAITSSSGVYAKSSHEWVRAPKLWNTPICKKGYMYHVYLKSCLLKKKHLAIHNVESSFMFSADQKILADNFWDSTMSIWVHHTKVPAKEELTGGVAVMGMAQIITLNITLAGTSGITMSLTAQYGPKQTLPNSDAIINVNTMKDTFAIKLGVWVHYGLVTVNTNKAASNFFDGVASSTDIIKLKEANRIASIFYYQDKISIPNVLLGLSSTSFSAKDLTIFLGMFLHGHIREARIWTKPLTKEEMYKAKY